ncbi:reticulon-like protein B1 isoform X2 [Brachypodium distachyon]|uniref:reticulon-like protein B1 isoform X2 n=1 Tax=Brachypodium distachyon TaxID=15368 RepID=UPI000D0CEF59|nr:reticulon-like protein B1 isoform X2 [Brachypodium distachyon]|eukprot:XP_024315397.1 reticulon-like protein B1 isoform X2 [Brachypodium distachyon]
MPPHFPSDSNHGRHAVRPLGRHKSIHRLLGGGEAADILLWKNRNLSAGVLAGATLIWFLFDVVEYNIIPLLSQIAIFVMLVIFIWSNAAPIFDRAPPRIPEVVISEHAFRELVLTSHHKLSYAVSLLYDIACGKDLKKLLLVQNPHLCCTIFDKEKTNLPQDSCAPTLCQHCTNDTRQKWTIYLQGEANTSRSSMRRLIPMWSAKYQEALSRQNLDKTYY